MKRGSRITTFNIEHPPSLSGEYWGPGRRITYGDTKRHYIRSKFTTNSITSILPSVSSLFSILSRFTSGFPGLLSMLLLFRDINNHLGIWTCGLTAHHPESCLEHGLCTHHEDNVCVVQPNIEIS